MSADRILLVSLDNLGDLVFASALAPPLRERFPGAALDVWCKEYTADVGRLVPGVSDVIASDPFWDVAPGTREGLARSVFPRVLRGEAPAVRRRVLAAAPWRTAAAVAATRIPDASDSAARKNRYFLTDVLPDESSDRPVMSELARLLAPLGIDAGRAPVSTRRVAARGATESDSCRHRAAVRSAASVREQGESLRPAARLDRAVARAGRARNEHLFFGLAARTS